MLEILILEVHSTAHYNTGKIYFLDFTFFNNKKLEKIYLGFVSELF